MPYHTVADLPAAVRSKLSPKKQRQWMHVWNSEYDAHGDEDRAFAAAWSAAQKSRMIYDITKSPLWAEGEAVPVNVEGGPNAIAKARQKGKEGETMTTEAGFSLYLPITKVDRQNRTVSGYASTPTRDLDGEIITLDAMRRALPDYWEYANIREMHQPKAVGVGKDAKDDGKGIVLTAKVVDDAAWQKVLEEVYKGFSIGGKVTQRDPSDPTIVTALDWIETSLVDRPANPDCKISVAKKAKGATGAYLIKAKPTRSSSMKALSKMAKAVEILTKEGPPAARDGFSLPAPGPNRSPKDDEIQVNKEGGDVHVHEIDGVTGPPKDPEEVDKGGDKPGEGDKPYGDVEYADPGLQADGKKRYPVDTEDHIRAAWNYINKPKNAKRYGDKIGRVRSKIISAWKSKIDPAGPPSAKIAKKLAKRLAKRQRRIAAIGAITRFKLNSDTTPSARVPSFLDLGKAEDTEDPAVLPSPSALSLPSSQRKEDGGNKFKLSKGETDQVRSLLGEYDMGELVADGGSPLEAAILGIVKRAATPSRAQRMEMARSNLRKARKARKAAEEGIKECASILKAAYLAKVAKKPKDSDADDGPESSAMEKLNKAFSSLRMMKTFLKAADGDIEKAAGRSGQREQEVSASEIMGGGKTESPSSMAGASPGGPGGGGQPPMYPDDGSVYPGKLAKLANKDGMVPAAAAELAAENAALAARVEVLGNMRVPGPRPYSFDVTKVAGGNGATPTQVDRQKAATLFSGVDTTAIGSGDRDRHQGETAKVIGNLLTNPSQFAKPILESGSGFNPVRQ